MMLATKASQLVFLISKKLPCHHTSQIKHWRWFAALTSRNEQIPIYAISGHCFEKTLNHHRHVSSDVSSTSLKKASDIIKKKKEQNEEERKTVYFYGSKCLYDIPHSGKFGDLVYTGKRVVALENHATRYFSTLIMSGTLTHILCKFVFSVPLLDQIYIVVPVLICHYLLFTRLNLDLATKYILCMYYDRKSKIFTAVTWTNPGLLVTELRLQRFSIEDVHRPTGSNHNIILKKEKRVIENDVSCFIDKSVYEMIKDRMQQENN